ncbi:MAG: HEAT repeat domain-containing protein [Planctomycetes bacterium]|nr:HEAT repeat domain-containing protein [Planctomycetota bacterium]
MLLQFCDKCGRPLSEGCIARGEAIERKGELVCSACVAKEQTAAAVQAATDEIGQETTGPLGHYEQAVWTCDSCGIPVTALDLIEGRAARIGELLHCARCAPATKDVPTEPAARPTPQRPQPKPRPAGRPSLPRAAAPRAAVSAPRHASAAAEEFLAEAKSEQKRPILPLVMFAIILPMFAVSLYFAITSQQKLNDVMGRQANSEAAPDARNRRPREQLQPTDFGNENPPGNQPETNQPGTNQPVPPEPAPHQPEPASQTPLSPGVVDDLVAIEKELAEPSIAKLQSKNLGEVWEGLIEVGSRRLIAARPYVRALLRDHDDKTRALACRVSGMLNDKEALPAISRMVENDPDESVRIEARKARDRMSGEATRELRDLTDKELQEMLNDIRRELERRRERND